MIWRNTFWLFVALCDLSVVLMAADYGIDIWTGGSPITPQLYGEAIYEIPAVAWAVFQGGGAFLGMVGAVIVAASSPDDAATRWGAAICALGNLSLTAMFVVFAQLSREADAGILMHSLTKFPGSLIFGGITVIALRLLIWGDEDVESVDR